MAKEVFNRYEHKYLLSAEVCEKVISELRAHMEPDLYNAGGKPYTIANIYYDTPDDYLIRSSLSKPVYKEKLRLRSYGVPKSGDMVFLEIKKKFNGIVNKRRTALFPAEAYYFVNTGTAPIFAPHINKQVLNELTYFLTRYTLLPKVYIAYDRLAFFEMDNDDLRISFDKNIRSRRYDLFLEKGDYGQQLLPPDMRLMEIKTSMAKPLWLTEILAKYKLNKTSFSKYGTEYADSFCRLENVI